MHLEKLKQSRWLSPGNVLAAHRSAGSPKAESPGSNGKLITAATEEGYHVIKDDELAATVVGSMDFRSKPIDDVVSREDSTAVFELRDQQVTQIMMTNLPPMLI